MAINKYERLIKPLSVGAINWEAGALATGQGNATRQIRLNGREHLEGLHLNVLWGVHAGLGNCHPGLDLHAHPYPECLLFVGLDTANVNYLGAEIEVSLGPEKEPCTFNEPTVVVIPAGLPHGPIITKRMYSPKGFGFWAVELNPVSEITWLREGGTRLPKELKSAETENTRRNKPVQSSGKYAHLVKPLRSGLLIERGKFNSSGLTAEQLARQNSGEKPGPGNADHLIWMHGKDLEGLDVSIFWGFCSQAGIWRRGAGAHVHPTDEVLIYLGLDPNDSDYLGAEIEIDMGQEHERHIINKSSVVICPAGTPHMPQVTRWVDKPFAFFAINLSGEHETKSFD